MSNNQLEKIFDNGTKLSKEQAAFKKRVEDINKLKDEWALLSQSIPKARAQFIIKTSSIRTSVNALLIKRIYLLEEALLSRKLSQKLKSEISDIIIQECYAILDMEDNKEVQEIIDRVQAAEPQEEQDMEKKLEKIFENAFPEMEDEEFLFESSQSSNQAKKKEAKAKIKSEAKKRSIRDIYKDLVKMAHPDKEMDEAQKKEKEELTKEINSAYKDNDLLKLLEFEILLIHASKERVNELAKERLVLYNEILLEQKQKLELDLYRIKHENELIYRGMCTKISKPEKFLQKVLSELRTEKERLEQEIFYLNNDKSFLKHFINGYMRHLEDEMFGF